MLCCSLRLSRSLQHPPESLVFCLVHAAPPFVGKSCRLLCTASCRDVKSGCPLRLRSLAPPMPKEVAGVAPETPTRDPLRQPSRQALSSFERGLARAPIH